MAQVSHAERLVNGICGQSFTGTIPDGVTSATLEFARYFMNIQMLTDGHLDEYNVKLNTITALCRLFLVTHHKTIDYASSAEDFDLRRLRD